MDVIVIKHLDNIDSIVFRTRDVIAIKHFDV
jgi:hypothetical protein